MGKVTESVASNTQLARQITSAATPEPAADLPSMLDCTQEPYRTGAPELPPVRTPEAPVDILISDEVQRAVNEALAPLYDIIRQLGHDIKNLQEERDIQESNIAFLHDKLSLKKTGSEHSPGIMNKLSWAVKNCFVKPAAGLICAGLVVGAVALVLTPFAAPSVLALGAIGYLVTPLLLSLTAAYALNAYATHVEAGNQAGNESQYYDDDAAGNDADDQANHASPHPPAAYPAPYPSGGKGDTHQNYPVAHAVPAPELKVS